jgi:putative ABC transport system permease protein
MFKNYLMIAVRNLLRFKTYSFINILGLAVGITCFLILSLFILDELSYDKFNKNADQTYRVYIEQNINGIEGNNSKTPGLLGPTLMQQLPETASFTRLGYFGQYRFRYKNKVFNEGNIYAVDSTFFDVFTLSFLEGNPKTALVHPNSIVLTKTVAKKYFGNKNPVGKTLVVEKSYPADYLDREENYVDKSKDFLVTGLIEDFPENSHFSCRFLTSISTYEVNEYWLDLWYSTYVVLKKGTDPTAYENKLKKIVEDKVGPVAESILGISIKEFRDAGNKYTYRLQPLTSIYLYSQKEYGLDLNTEWGDIKNSDITYVYIFSAVAIFILLIAVVNFMNLATARSDRRSKEVGIRKTLGSNKLKLIRQFIGEAILMSLFAVIISLALVEIILPFFNSLAGKELKLDLFGSLYTIPLLVAFILFVGILAGSYPAFYLSSFKPAKVLKSNYSIGNRKNIVRSGLVIFQFAVSITLLIGTIVVKNQLDYIRSKNLGFNKEHLYCILNGNALRNRIEPFKEELLKNSNITAVTNTSQMFRAGVPGNGYLFNKMVGTDPTACQFIEVDYDFLKTYQIKLKEGRYFSKEFSSDTSSVLINEAAARIFGDNEPVGKELTRIGRTEWSKTFKIIGIVKDFNYESLHYHVRPLILHLSPPSQAANVLTIRLSSDNLKETIGYIDETWKTFTGGEGLYSRFVDENIARLYESDEKIGIVATIFSILAIFIASLGVFGLASLVTEQRTKEIGIRKALGASVSEIILILSKEFAIWVLLANIIACPIAYFFMNKWLQDFAFRINIAWWVFVIAGCIALLIALATVSFQAIKAATANPVESLRYE